MHGVRVLMFGVTPTNNKVAIKDMIASNIEEYINEYLGSVITEEDIA